MASSLFKLVGEIFVDNTQANTKIDDTGNKVETTGSKFANGLKTAAKWGAGVAAAAVAVGTAMYKATEKVAETMDEIDKGSIRMGVDTKYYQELSYAAGQCGVEMSTLEKAAKKLEGTDINFDDAIDSIMALTTEEERSAKAAELFGESVAYQMSPMLKGGAEEFDALTQRANDLGLVFSEDTVAAGVTLGDTMSDVKKSLGAVGTQLAAELMPIVQKVLDWVIEHMPEIRKIISDVCSTISSVIKAVWPIVKPIIEGIATGFEWIVDTIGKVAEGFKNLKIPKLKLPHFSVTPKGWKVSDLLKGDIPKLGIEWYKKAMDEPRLLTSPTIFGASNGQMLGGGEAGNELVVGQAKMMEMIQSATADQFDQLVDRVDNVLNVLIEYLPQQANTQLVMDTGAIVGAITPSINDEMWRIYKRNERGG